MTDTPIIDTANATEKPRKTKQRVDATVRSSQSGKQFGNGANSTSDHHGASLIIARPSAAQTERAMREFYEQVKQIPGLTKIETRGGKSWNQKAILVVVPDLFSEAMDRVSTLEGDIYRAYPGARLRVEVEDAVTYNSYNVSEASEV